ncbi:hypothetical protein [Nonomuraea lactucae]|uniref:hypothetical protein n=1 Tax=Nonomuraea lactucae TaxID=2249762 RepID=UPI000DE3CA35|nr:hypothetical protein [Nonomuraea lactucae]
MSKTAQKAEAHGTPLPVEYNGVTYLVPPSMDWDADVLDLLESGRLTSALRMILGAEQYEQFRATKPKLRQAMELMEAIGSTAGTGN